MNLVKSTGTFGFYTIISRLLGYLRDVLIAIFLGTSFLADVFFVAFRIPNTFRRLFAEGTFNAAFIPSYTSELVKKKTGSQKFAEKLLSLNTYFSASGIITFKNSVVLQNTFNSLPLDKILIETDSPFLAPVPNRGKKNEPSFIDFIAAKLAEIKDMEKSEIIKITTNNFNQLFFN